MTDSDAVRVDVPADDAEMDALATVLTQVFTVAEGAAATREWLDRAGRENVRVATRGGAVAGGLLLLPMGQWFGGRVVRMAGVAGVGVAPEHRAQRVATTMMREVVRGLRAAGFPLSALYPATQPLYRSVGYERAGVEMRLSVDADRIDLRDRAASLRRATDADHAAVEECYRERARGAAGLLDRSEYLWRRVRGVKQPAYGYVVEEGGRVTGHTYFVHQPTDDVPHLACTDLVATTPGAARRLLTLFADHRSMARQVRWRGAPGDPLLHALREQRDVAGQVVNTWMLRVLDVDAALTARGWPAGVSAEVHLDVADDLLPENAGRRVLTISDGVAAVARGGRGSLRCDVRGLAAVYSGFLSPYEAVACGALDGPPDEVAAAAAVFAGPLPWMADHF